MRCPTCAGSLEVTHVYTVDDGMTTRDLECQGCGLRVTSLAILLPRAGRGSAARALAARLRAGEVTAAELAEKVDTKRNG